jgi:hypothetical protein
MNFVTQPSVELYKSITGRIAKAKASEKALESTHRTTWRGCVTLRTDHFPPAPGAAPAVFAGLVSASGTEYGELTFFGDTRYDARGRAARLVLDRAAEQLFRRRLKQPVDVYEGPAMNHSYHEMIIGHGRCFSTIIIADTRDPDGAYHRAQFLATEQALAERCRSVVAIHLKDLSERTLKALDEFFREAARALPKLH